MCWLMLLTGNIIKLNTMHARIQKVLSVECQTLTLRGEGGSMYQHQRAIIGTPAFRWRAYDSPTLNAGLVALPPPPLDPRMQ